MLNKSDLEKELRSLGYTNDPKTLHSFSTQRAGIFEAALDGKAIPQ